MKEKICFVVSSAMTVNAFLLQPIKKLGKQYDVYIVLNGEVKDISDSLENITILFAPIERKITFFQDLNALFILFRLFRRYRFKLVQSVSPKAGLLAMLGSFFARTPLRIHIFTGQVWATRTGFARSLLKWMDSVTAFMATDLLVDSASQRQFLLNEKLTTASKLSVLANGSISGVDTKRFCPNDIARDRIRKQFSIEKNDVVFLFIGRLNKEKGVLDLAKSFSKLTDQTNHLLFVGPDEAGMKDEILAILNNKVEQVHFVGFADDPESYMAASDVLCLPSYREGFGSVIIEAATVGIPAIGSKIYGVEDAIENGYSGLLFTVGDINELCKQMNRLSADIHYRQKLGVQARKRAIKKFNSDLISTAWLEYYQGKL